MRENTLNISTFDSFVLNDHHVVSISSLLYDELVRGPAPSVFSSTSASTCMQAKCSLFAAGVFRWCRAKRWRKCTHVLSLGACTCPIPSLRVCTRSLTWSPVYMWLCLCVCAERARTAREVLKLAGKMPVWCTLARKEVDVCCFNYDVFNVEDYFGHMRSYTLE